MSASTEIAQQLYVSQAEGVRPKFGDTEQQARAYYARYVGFVNANVPCTPARILDVGCGGGWSTLLMRELGHQAEGLDLHASEVEARAVAPDLPYTQGDASKLPFAADTFDAVAMYQVLEHVPTPERALEESMRVLRRGGRLIVVGPNLIGAALNLYYAAGATVRCLKEGRLWESRTPAMPRHPGGNTMPEAWLSTARHLTWTLQKLVVERTPHFRLREPDVNPPFHADNDACYFCNPMDLVNWARDTERAIPRRWWAADRRLARVMWPFGGGTWVVLEKA